jgi:hypothetical protein
MLVVFVSVGSGVILMLSKTCLNCRYSSK